MSKNKASRAARGLDVRMETLRQFAEFFDVALESILVSPLRRLSPAEERRVAERLAEEASRVIDQRRPSAVVRRIDHRMIAIAKRVEKLKVKHQKTLIKIIADYEKLERKEKSEKKEGDGGGGAPPKKG